MKFQQRTHLHNQAECAAIKSPNDQWLILALACPPKMKSDLSCERLLLHGPQIAPARVCKRSVGFVGSRICAQFAKTRAVDLHYFSKGQGQLNLFRLFYKNKTERAEKIPLALFVECNFRWMVFNLNNKSHGISAVGNRSHRNFLSAYNMSTDFNP